MMTSLENDTNDIQRITSLLNNYPMYTTEKEGDNQNLRKDENLKSIPKAAVKDNIDIISIYLNINKLHFKNSLKTKIFEDISEDPFPAL